LSSKEESNEQANFYPVFKTWCFQLEEPRTGEQHGFTNLEEVMAFIQSRFKETDGDVGNGLFPIL
jgi:hypothetical protein